MSCCSRTRCGPVHAPKLPEHYETVRFLCAVAITALAVKALPQTFAKWSVVGLGLHLGGRVIKDWPQLSEDLSQTPETCASGCTDIVAQSYRLKFDPRLSLIIAAIFFCCHIEHHATEMVPVVGAVFGFRVFHWINPPH
ncbi:hypothetical protein [Simkania sp.]|uniref:hypothetical protein n=1 Tax=Simkania sp. TaxID=34094 RepID=UPI003B529EFE